MSVFDELITDRTSEDVTNRTAKGSISYVVDLVTKTDWTMRDFRTDSDMQRIRGNIQALRDAYFTKPTTPATPQRIEYQSVTEANNIEHILADIYEMYQSSMYGPRRLAFRLGTRPIGDRR